MKRTLYEVPEFDLLPLAAKMRLTGENVVETLRREAINSALSKTAGCQSEAAELLGITPRVMNWWCRDLQLRPVDRDVIMALP